MKKVMLFVVSMLFAVGVNAASLSLTNSSTINANQSVSGVVNNGPVAIGGGDTSGGTWSSFFNLTTDLDTAANVEWSFNPESAVTTATLKIWDAETLTVLHTVDVVGDYITSFNFLAGTEYWVDFYSVTSSALSYDVSVSTISAIPVPAALLLFAPALLGFLGLRRKATPALAA
jgi:hypothetical protein